MASGVATTDIVVDGVVGGLEVVAILAGRDHGGVAARGGEGEILLDMLLVAVLVVAGGQ